MALPPFSISPTLLNSSNPWATTKEDLLALYDCPFTGAVTLRTSLWGGFPNDAKIHQYAFFSSAIGHSTIPVDEESIKRRDVRAGEPYGVNERCSLNTLGYSPLSFEEYMNMLVEMSRDGSLSGKYSKPFIISVSGTAEEVGRCAKRILKVMNEPEVWYQLRAGEKAGEKLNLMMEINLSCPNIPDKPPPAYDFAELREYLNTISYVTDTLVTQSPGWKRLHMGIKTPPYTHAGQFSRLILALEKSTILLGGCPITFITATNTLGSCLVLDSSASPALGSANGMGIGGLAGEALHPLALGNVKTIRDMLDKSNFKDVRNIKIIGIGGVSDAAGWNRMMTVGATAVGVGTALGRKGVGIFEEIAMGVGREEFA